MRYCFNLILSPHFLASRKCVVECFEFNIHINLDRNVLSKFSKKFLISNAKASLERETLMCSSWSKEDTRNSFSLKTITVFDNPTLIFQCCRCRPISTTKGVLHGRSSLIGAFFAVNNPTAVGYISRQSPLHIPQYLREFLPRYLTNVISSKSF